MGDPVEREDGGMCRKEGAGCRGRLEWRSRGHYYGVGLTSWKAFLGIRPSFSCWYIREAPDLEGSKIWGASWLAGT